MNKTSKYEYLSIENPDNKRLEFYEYRLRKLGVRVIFASYEKILSISTEEILIEVNISTYDETRRELDHELSRLIEETWIIGEILDYFDEKWSEIEEFVGEKAIVLGGKVE
jgi:hypothetical protein